MLYIMEISTKNIFVDIKIKATKIIQKMPFGIYILSFVCFHLSMSYENRGQNTENIDKHKSQIQLIVTDPIVNITDTVYLLKSIIMVSFNFQKLIQLHSVCTRYHQCQYWLQD